MNKLITILFAIIALSAGLNSSKAQSNSSNSETKEQALQLINLPDPTFKPYVAEKIDSQTLAEKGLEQVYEAKPVKFKMKDGKKIFANHFIRANSRFTIILLHGVLSSSFKMNKTAGLLREAAESEVFALDFRGHGQSEGKSGDVDYIDQYAEDLAEVIANIRKDKPRNKIILAGHSMGGGICLRYSMMKNRPAIDGFLLFAPLLGQNTPTFPQGAKVETDREPFLKIHIQRLIGLKMLNSIGEHKYDGLNVLFFNVAAEAPIKTYTYRANESMAPVDYRQGLNSVKEPLLVLVGSMDEAFTASAFEDAVKFNSGGEVFVIQGATHNGIRHNPKAMQLIKEWFTTKIIKEHRY